MIGEHGITQVPLFSSVRIDGRPVSFTEAEKQAHPGRDPKIFERYEELQAGRTAGWTCAIGLAALTRAIVKDTGEIFPCSAVLDGEYGQRGLSMGVPVRLGKTGYRRYRNGSWRPTSRRGSSAPAAAQGGARIVDETSAL